MAFSDQLDWNSISLMIHFSKISKLPEIVNQTNIEVMHNPSFREPHTAVLSKVTFPSEAKQMVG